MSFVIIMRRIADTWCSPEAHLMNSPLESCTHSLRTETVFAPNWAKSLIINVCRSSAVCFCTFGVNFKPQFLEEKKRGVH